MDTVDVLDWLHNQTVEMQRLVVSVGRHMVSAGNTLLQPQNNRIASTDTLSKLDTLHKMVQTLSTSHQHLSDSVLHSKTHASSTERVVPPTLNITSCFDMVVRLINTHLRGSFISPVSHKNFLKLTIQAVDGFIYCHDKTKYINQTHIDEFIQVVRSHMSCANPPRFAIFVGAPDWSIPGCPTFFDLQLVQAGTSRCTALYVSGVERFPDRLINLVKIVTTLIATNTNGQDRDARAREQKISHLVNMLRDIISDSKSTITQQTEIQNFASGIADSSRTIVENLNNRIQMVQVFLRRHKLLVGSFGTRTYVGSAKQNLESIIHKLCSAWQDLIQKGTTLTRQNTISAVMRLYPGQIQGFKNPNCLANTLRYYNTSFKVEKSKYLTRRDQTAAVNVS